MGVLIGLLAIVGVIAWLTNRGATDIPAPEDDVTTPIDRAALEEAERELREDGGARPIGDELDEDDWGPGTGGKSGLPGLF